MIKDRDAVPGGPAEGDETPAQGAEFPVEEDGSSPEVEAFAAETAAGETLAPAPGAGGVDYKDKWLRTEADLQNFRRRAARDREEAVERTQESVLLDAIGVLDDLERALAALTPKQAAEPWAKGIVMTAQRMRDMLGRWNVSEIEAVGHPFDPSVHEALLEIDAPVGVAPGAVAQVVQKGYRRGPRALRAARVVVARSAAKG